MDYLIIGNGIAGISAAETIRAKAPEGGITLISDESCLAYSRFLLPWYAGGCYKRERLWCRSSQWYRRLKLNLIRNAPVEDISMARASLKTGAGQTLHFDRLLFATGSKSRSPLHPGPLNPGENVFPMRCKEDGERIRALLKDIRHGIVIGGGRTGIQTAAALRSAGKAVTLLEKRDRLLSEKLDETASSLVEKELAGLGVSIVKSTKAISLDGVPPRMNVKTADGGSLEGQIVISAAGTIPRTGLAASAGIPVRQGILVDRRLQTQVPRVFGAGEAVEIENQNPAKSWTEAMRQGRIAGANMTGAAETFGGRTGLFSLCVGSLVLISYGPVDPWDVSGINIASRLTKNSYYRKAVIEDHQVIGFLCIGNLKRDSAAGLIWDKERIQETLCGLPAEHPDQVLDRLDLLAGRTYRGLSVSFTGSPFLFG